MFIEVSGRRQGDKAWLVSSPMAAPTGVCTLRLWYHMRGSRIQDLNIWYRTYTGGPLYAVASLSGTKGDVWYKLTSTITLGKNFGRPFEVVIEGWYIKLLLYLRGLLWEAIIEARFIKLLLYFRGLFWEVIIEVRFIKLSLYFRGLLWEVIIEGRIIKLLLYFRRLLWEVTIQGRIIKLALFTPLRGRVFER